jgi:hypothetical protein
MTEARREEFFIATQRLLEESENLAGDERVRVNHACKRENYVKYRRAIHQLMAM